jgi:dolichol-phosphate mannosyltransferase
LAADNRSSSDWRIGVVIPCFRVQGLVLEVISKIEGLVEAIYVVDDKCPDQTGKLVQDNCADPRVRVIFLDENQGVGGAVLAGVSAAIRDGMDIIVKIDGDGQMDPTLLPLFVKPIKEGMADLTKGNRFYNPDDIWEMPTIRIFGNAALSFFSKLSSGYWNIFDPTNGYLAADARLMAALPLDKIQKRYFFESDLLFRVGLMRAKVMDIPMAARYGKEKSNLRIRSEVFPFFLLHFRNFWKRLMYNYFLRDFNIASLELVFGMLLLGFGTIYALVHWGGEEPAAPGVVMIAALPLLTGIILLLSFVNFDAQQIPREAISSRLAQRSGTG